MNKFIKFSGALFLTLSLLKLCNKKDRKRIKSAFVTDRQLLNRLKEQINVSKSAQSNLFHALHRVNPISVNHQINQFNKRVKTELAKIHSESLRLGDHLRS